MLQNGLQIGIFKPETLHNRELSGQKLGILSIILTFPAESGVTLDNVLS